LYVCGGKHINHFIASIVLKLVLENDFTLSWCRKYVQENSGSIRGSSLTHLSYVSCNGDETSLSECTANNGSSCYGYNSRRVQISCSSGKTHHWMV
jgi:hypothetical protein